jgi:phage terminase small subunit
MIIKQSANGTLSKPLPRSATKHLPDSAARTYERMLPAFDAVGINSASLGLVVCYCQAWSLGERAYTEIREEGLTIPSKQSYLCKSGAECLEGGCQSASIVCQVTWADA